MTVQKLTSKYFSRAVLAGIIGIGGVSAAYAQTATFNVTNTFGSTISLNSASCTSGSISAPASIANNSTQSFSGSTTSGSTLCTVRYASGSFGCQFVVDATNFGQGFANANAFEGSNGMPGCSGSGPQNTGNETGTFTMSPHS